MSLMSKGWECPKCGRVNAPWAAVCPCYIVTHKNTNKYTMYGSTSPAYVYSPNSDSTETIASGYCDTNCSNCKETCGGNKI